MDSIGLQKNLSLGVSRVRSIEPWKRQFLGQNVSKRLERRTGQEEPTLYVRHALLENLLRDLRVLELLVDLGNDSICEFLLLALLDLTFVSDP